MHRSYGSTHRMGDRRGEFPLLLPFRDPPLLFVGGPDLSSTLCATCLFAFHTQLVCPGLCCCVNHEWVPAHVTESLWLHRKTRELFPKKQS